MTKEKKNLEPLLYKDLKLEQVAFEIRYVSNNHFQQKIRQFWQEIRSNLDGHFNPLQEDQTYILNYENKFEVRVSSNSFAVIEFFPNKSLKEFLEVNEAFFNTTNEVLEIVEIMRVGLRLFFSKNYEDARSVVDALYQTGYINYPPDLHLVKEGNPLIPNYTIGWQDKEKGITYRLNGKSETIGFDLPLRLIATGEFPETIEKSYNQLILDIDVYVYKPISPGQFFLKEWIEQAFNTGKDECKKFFGDE